MFEQESLNNLVRIAKSVEGIDLKWVELNAKYIQDLINHETPMKPIVHKVSEEGYWDSGTYIDGFNYECPHCHCIECREYDYENDWWLDGTRCMVCEGKLDNE